MDSIAAPEIASTVVGSPPSPRTSRRTQGNYKGLGHRGDRGKGQRRGHGRGSSFSGQRELPPQVRPAPQLQQENSHAAGTSTVAHVERKEMASNITEVAATGDVEAEVCFICASPVVHNSVAHCNHRTCHICALRMRALYKNKACLHCRTHSEFVVFTDNTEKRYEDFVDQDFARTDENLGIKYEDLDIFEDTLLLLRYNCPDPSCDIACYGWPDLHRHVRNVHNKIMCDLCTRSKKVFTHEHELFTHNELRRHERYGDDKPGAVDQSGFKGHPECGFCHERFYGDDELYAHCRDKHERCHICDRISTGRQQQYYLNYDALEIHFKKDHFLCPDQECLDKKFMVFESEMDLKAHQLETHPNGLSKDARRDARRVDMSGFDYRTPHHEPRSDHRDSRGRGRGRGRGRDPNVDALPVSSAQPMRRDELAFQRQLAIHSAQSVSNRTFGGQLTQGDAYVARAPQAAEPSTVTASKLHEVIPNDQISNSTNPLQESVIPKAALTPQEQARQLRHASVTERATTLLHNSATKLTTFRSKVSDYRSNSISADALIDSFFALFDAPSSDIGILIKELAEIFEVEGKRDALLKAWNDWRAINEDYPSLPGPNGLPAGGVAAAGLGGKRILKLKSSTAQSSLSAAARPATWAATSGIGGGSSSLSRGSAFPPMASMLADRTRPNKGTTAAWAAHASGSTSTTRASTVSSKSSGARPTTRPILSEAFPSLPVTQKPGMNVSRPGFAGNPVLKARSGTSTPVNAWAVANAGGELGGNLTDALDAATIDNDMEDDAATKKKGKKKQTLYHWG